MCNGCEKAMAFIRGHTSIERPHIKSGWVDLAEEVEELKEREVHRDARDASHRELAHVTHARVAQRVDKDDVLDNEYPDDVLSRADVDRDLAVARRHNGLHQSRV